MNYYNEIKNRIIDNEIYGRVKDYSKERNTVITYFEIGKLLNEAGGKYGDNIINEYSKKLVLEVGKKYNKRTLFRMKQFYIIFSNEKVSPLATQLTWSHYTELLPIKDLNNEEKLIETCNAMKKIKLGCKATDILLDGIMNYDVGDQRVLKFIDLEGISFADRCVRDVDFRGTNADVDPQTVQDKNINGANFEGIDMSNKCFDGCVICHANLSYTNAIIDPQKVYKKDLDSTKCDGLDLSHSDFTDVYVDGSSFKNAKINLDPQKVRYKSLTGTNLENVDMSEKDFNGCKIEYCNLINTNAVLNINYLDIDNLWGCKLQGTTLLVGEGFNRKKLEDQHVELGLVKKDDYTLTKRKIKSIFNKINKQ